MRFSPVEEYGLRCLMQLARHAENEQLNIRAIAEAEGLSIAYVAKLMALLQKGGLVKAQRGVQGGYTLTKTPDKITMDEVMRALDPGSEKNICEQRTGQKEVCVHADCDCGLKSMWAGVAEHLHNYLKGITLAGLMTVGWSGEKR